MLGVARSNVFRSAQPSIQAVGFHVHSCRRLPFRPPTARGAWNFLCWQIERSLKRMAIEIDVSTAGAAILHA